MAKKSLRVAVDIGGTFADVQVIDTASGDVWDHKVPSTPDDPSASLINGLRGAVEKRGFGVDAIDMILHGSTIATNAVLERKLPKGALITTEGFTDVLAIGRHMRRDVYALKAEPRPVLIPAERRIGICERMRADGSVETPLDEAAVERAGRALVADGVRTVAVMFLHAYRNPEHELAAADILSNIPGLTVATSHETSPEIREFERASTTVLNALLKPVISTYLGRVEHVLGEAGIDARLFLVQSNGGVATPAEAARLPVRLLFSGPSGGAMAVRSLARRHGLDNVVGMDMGGTSTDVSVLQSGGIEERAEGDVAGLPVRLPMIDIRTIGAGGGSIASSEQGALRVGPESAGADPGPSCYLRGGVQPTVTDANLQLGFINPANFLGGRMPLGADEARAAIASVADGLGLDATAMAGGIVAVANAAMADAVRLSLFEKGADPSAFVLAAFGGAGGLHACAVAEELDMRRVLFPAMASTLSARGILDSDIRHDLIEACLMIVDAGALPSLTGIVANLRTKALALLDADGIEAAAQRIEIAADLRYRGQAWEITTPWPLLDVEIDKAAIAALVQRFHDLHKTQFAHNAPDDPVEIVAVRAKAIGMLDRITANDDGSGDRFGRRSMRRVHVGGGWHDVAVVPRDALGPDPISGPLMIEEDYSGLWIHAGWSVRMQPTGDIIATREERAP